MDCKKQTSSIQLTSQVSALQRDLTLHSVPVTAQLLNSPSLHRQEYILERMARMLGESMG